MDPVATVRHKYNPDYYYSRATQVLETVTNAEADAWFSHPCTQAIMLMLEGDMANIVASWKNGAYTSNTTDQTIQLNSKYLGMAQGIETVLENIKDVRRKDVVEGEE